MDHQWIISWKFGPYFLHDWHLCSMLGIVLPRISTVICSAIFSFGPAETSSASSMRVKVTMACHSFALTVICRLVGEIGRVVCWRARHGKTPRLVYDYDSYLVRLIQSHTKSYKANKFTASWRDWLICSEDTGLRFAQRGEKEYLCSHAWFSDAVDSGRLRHKNLGAGPNLPKYSFSTSILFRVGGTSQWMCESQKPAQSSSLKQKKINAKLGREPASPQCLHLPLHFVPVDLTVICAYLRKSEKKTHLCEKRLNMLKIKLVNYLHQRSSKCYRRYRFAMALLWSMDVYGLLVELTFAAVPLRGGGCVGGGLATAQRRNGNKSKWPPWKWNESSISQTLTQTVTQPESIESNILKLTNLNIKHRPRKFRSQTSDNMDRWKAELGRGRGKRKAEEWRSEKRKGQKKEDAGARKGRKVAKQCIFPMIWGSGGSKSRLARAAGAEPAGQMRDEKLHAVAARSAFPSQNVQNTWCSEHFWKLRCRKSARRCGAKHISKSKVQKTEGHGALLGVQMSFCVVGRRDCAPCQKWAKHEGFVACPKTMAGVAQYKRHVHERCSEVRALISWEGLHFGASGLQVCWDMLSSSNFEEASQNCKVFDAVKFKNRGSLANNFIFQSCR